MGDAMRLGGFLVSPEEIESVIQAQPGVAGVQVVAALRGAAEPVPVAFVRPADGAELDEAALRTRCLEQLARFKVPERIVAGRIVSDLSTARTAPKYRRYAFVRCPGAVAGAAARPAARSSIGLSQR